MTAARKAAGSTIMVPVGFTTDFASIPRIFWIVLPKWGKYGNAAVIHDYLYYDQKLTRKEADDVLLEAMGVLEVPQWQRCSIYRAVRWFGSLAWSLNNRKKAAGYSKVSETAPVKATDKPSHWKIEKKEWVRIVFGRRKAQHHA